MNTVKRFLPDALAVVFFIVLSVSYFAPATFEGRVLFQHDSRESVGAGVEAQDYLRRTGERTRWTNAIFGGMPTYQMSPSYDSTRPLQAFEKLYHLFLPQYVWYVFALLLGFYILLRAFDFSVWLSSVGAILWAFSSYYLIIISAGHIWKVVTLAYVPPAIAGMVLAYRGRLLAGGVAAGLFMALQILSNHFQMTYYFLFVMLAIAVAYGVQAWREGQLKRFAKATGVLLAAGAVGVAVNASNLYHTYQYSKETMRSKSELSMEGADKANQTKDGLDRDYITQWSYGVGETFSLLVPNVKGGASVPLAASETAMEEADPRFAQAGIYHQLPQYFGEQPGTSGPVYVGAFVVMLALLALFLVRGPLKWALLAATILSILLSWGKNFMPFTDFFLDYVPMYDKFRAVSSILVIAEFTIPLLAVMALAEILRRPAVLREKARQVWLCFALTGGLSLLFAVAPRLLFPDYVPTGEMAMLRQALPAEYLAPLVQSLEEMRTTLFAADAWRSFAIVATGTALLLLCGAGRLKPAWMLAAVGALCLADLWTVGKRYLNDAQFVPRETEKVVLRKTATDEAILQDKALDYRVLNFASNTFNESNTAYWHKSVGGYHPAKLRRYQEMIDRHIAPEMAVLRRYLAEPGASMDSLGAGAAPAINMLNTRHFILPADDGNGTRPLRNPWAMGNAWMVDRVRFVDSADEEIDGVGTEDLRRTAVVDRRFAPALGNTEALARDTAARIRLTAYEPNRLVYEYESAAPCVAVFSEIYYPGWTSTVDGQPAPHGRADYILRAMALPAGRHTVEFRFDPRSLHVTEAVSYAGTALLALGALALLLREARRRKRAA